MGYDLVSENGKVILVGVPKVGSNISLHITAPFGKSIIGSHGGESESIRTSQDT